jgi:DNA-binding Xre family transcriptional regulator
MIKTEKDYRECRKKLDRDRDVIEKQRELLAKQGFTSEEIEIALEPAWCFYVQLEEEAKWYEKVCRGEFEEVFDLTHIGRMLIGLRIANGFSQRDLAGKLGIDESQISRDERNEYHGITLERAQKIVEAMGEAVRIDIVPRQRARQPALV